ncbi:Anaerobic benzoate catabolism transcriptional regulator, partial [Dysosmobacter welbionis]
HRIFSRIQRSALSRIPITEKRPAILAASEQLDWHAPITGIRTNSRHSESAGSRKQSRTMASKPSFSPCCTSFN